MCMNKVIDIQKAVDMVHDGDSIMFGGFEHIGSPRNLIQALSRTGVKNLHVIADDIGCVARGFSQTLDSLLKNGQIASAKCCFLGMNPDASRLYLDGKLDVEFIPMGTLAERIRAGGCGMGGFYTRTGVGTLVEEGKETKIINGEKYLLELPIHAAVAFVKAYRADKMGNAIFKYTANNLNTVMATAADLVILEAEEVVEVGEIEPDRVQLPGVFIDYVVEAKEAVL